VVGAITVVKISFNKTSLLAAKTNMWWQKLSYDCVLHAHAHVAVELSVLAITGIYKLFMPSKILLEIILCMLSY
jgi:hypothetical protein